MLADIYRSKSRKDLYLFVPGGTEVKTYLAHVLSQFGELEFVKSRELLPGQKLIGANAEEIIFNLDNSGFHVQGVKITTEVSEGGAALGGGILGASVAGPIGALFGAVLGYALAEHAKKVSDEL